MKKQEKKKDPDAVRLGKKRWEGIDTKTISKHIKMLNEKRLKKMAKNKDKLIPSL